ncbi:hypothetical protein WA158_001504 [Blastocystis sp. Blastoise]
MSQPPVKKFDEQFKVLMLGDSGSGKTCIVRCYCDGTFAKSYVATIGVDFKIKYISIDNKIIKTQIWDTAGTERFRSVVSSYFRGAQGVVLVYDVTKKSSFDKIGSFMGDIRKNASSDIRVVLVGNKIDLMQHRMVTYDEGKELADQFGIPFFETSAATGQNIDDTFEAMVQECLQAKSDIKIPKEKEKEKNKTIEIKKPENNNDKKCC